MTFYSWREIIEILPIILKNNVILNRQVVMVPIFSTQRDEQQNTDLKVFHQITMCVPSKYVMSTFSEINRIEYCLFRMFNLFPLTQLPIFGITAVFCLIALPKPLFLLSVDQL